MKILDLEIDFPEILGISERQKQYAENLREVYVTQHEERFREISNILMRELDYRIKNDFNGVTGTYFEDFNENEKCCLFCTNAGGVIAQLKISLELERE